MAEAFLNRLPQPVTREVRITLRHRADYFPSPARFKAGHEIGAPVENEVVVPEDRVDWPSICEHLGTRKATVFGRYERTVRAFRTESQRVGVRVVFEDATEAVFFKLRFA